MEISTCSKAVDYVQKELSRNIFSLIGKEGNMNQKTSHSISACKPDNKALSSQKFNINMDSTPTSLDSAHIQPLITNSSSLLSTRKERSDHLAYDFSTQPYEDNKNLQNSTNYKHIDNIMQSKTTGKVTATNLLHTSCENYQKNAVDKTENLNKQLPSASKLSNSLNSWELQSHQVDNSTNTHIFISHAEESLNHSLEYQSSNVTPQKNATSGSKLQNNIESETIHVLGMGPAGQFIAHSIARLEHAPPVVLLMHRPLQIQLWHDEGAAIRIYRGGKIFSESNFHVESSANFRRTSPEQNFVGFGENLEHTSEPPIYAIDTLIVATPASATVSALLSVQHRIRPTTTICLIQDGMGMIHKINRIVFPDAEKRPIYVLGYMRHDLGPTDNFFSHFERSPSKLYCSKMPRISLTELQNGATIERVDFSWSPQARHLVGTLLRTPELNTAALGHKDFHKRQLSRLVVSAVIEPLAVAFDCVNGQLLENFGVANIMRGLIQEISVLIPVLPELRNIKNVQRDFSPERLEKKILNRIQKSDVMVSSMLAAIRQGKKADIDFFTGYLLERARELNIPCPVNQVMYHLVKAKQTMKLRESQNDIPYVGNQHDLRS
ncbi:Bgt-332 [Blumeria graminis f. sp. tritici]|uniref:Bgt-332 n=2 Tax=Blumeria graminis f. sp. tritici TaxID=62690 RepID=A0A9X9PQK9_BLUGR|nr:2-dehydropantoate 2-reductase [Blumeria graminis f. sp. tritici 96224]VCU39084.1 Bgt-332 [Blumeria graminis f. sp. tritici]